MVMSHSEIGNHLAPELCCVAGTTNFLLEDALLWFSPNKTVAHLHSGLQARKTQSWKTKNMPFCSLQFAGHVWASQALDCSTLKVQQFIIQWMRLESHGHKAKSYEKRSLAIWQHLRSVSDAAICRALLIAKWYEHLISKLFLAFEIQAMLKRTRATKVPSVRKRLRTSTDTTKHKCAP